MRSLKFTQLDIYIYIYNTSDPIKSEDYLKIKHGRDHAIFHLEK